MILNNRIGLKKLLVVFAAIIPVVYFFWNIYLYAVNIPYNDDYDTVLGFMNQFLNVGGLKERFDLIAGFWNDHRIAFNKIVIVLMYHLMGHIDLKWMIFIGNMGLILMIGSVFQAFKVKENKLLYFLPALFLFFQPMYSENSFFAGASLANFYIMSFGFLALALLDKKEQKVVSFILAILFAVLSYYSLRNGILFLALGLFMLICQKRYRESAFWLFISIAAVLFYQFYNVAPAAASASSILSLFNLKEMGRMILYFLVFIGNNFGTNFSAGFGSGSKLVQMVSFSMPVIAGLAVCAYFIYLTIMQYYKKNILIYSLFLFLFLTAIGASIDRGGGLGLAQALTSRYRVVTILFFILAYLSFIEILGNSARKKVFFTIAMVLSLLFNVFTYILKHKPILRHREDLIVSLNQWIKIGKGIDPLAHPYPYANVILAESVKRKIYIVPEIRK
jgi:hypothetical protein